MCKAAEADGEETNYSIHVVHFLIVQVLFHLQHINGEIHDTIDEIGWFFFEFVGDWISTRCMLCKKDKNEH